MQLTPDGFWLDPGEINESIGLRAAEMIGFPCDPVSCEIDPYYHPEDTLSTDESDSSEELGWLTDEFNDDSGKTNMDAELESSNGDGLIRQVPPIPVPPSRSDSDDDVDTPDQLTPPRSSSIQNGQRHMEKLRTRSGRTALRPISNSQRLR